ncbi:hypothetical protein Tco_1118196 [Tanacetum coccineum]
MNCLLDSFFSCLNGVGSLCFRSGDHRAFKWNYHAAPQSKWKRIFKKRNKKKAKSKQIQARNGRKGPSQSKVKSQAK